MPPKDYQAKLHHKNHNYDDPRARDTLPIIHNLRILHRDFFVAGKHLSKSDKLGIHTTIEKIILDCLALAVEASYRSTQTKVAPLEILRIRISVLKNLIRTENELGVIGGKTYLRLAEQIVEISKMANGWLSYATQKER